MLNDTLPDRFWSKVEKTKTCWIWTASKDRHGYGHFWHEGRLRLVHRLIYETLVGPIPEGKVIDHICHTRHCLRPDHLRIATNQENVEYKDGARKDNLTTGVRNVTKRGNGFRVKVTHLGKDYRFGTFATLEEAERVAIAARARLFTFPEDVPSGLPPVRTTVPSPLI